MIQNINIKKFGLFFDYDWITEIGNADNDCFKKVNIIYGRNYSGKTTLSRIFRCIEKGKIHKDYLNADFSINSKSQQDPITHNNLGYANKIRVYNSDFIRENLGWLHNENGEILPFALLGASNIESEKRIGEIESELGSIEASTGLYYKENTETEILKKLSAEKQEKENIKNNKLTDEAKKIKSTTPNYVRHGTSYIRTNLEKEIDYIIEKGEKKFLLSEEEKDSLKKLIKEEQKADIPSVILPETDLLEHVKRVKELIEKKITLTDTLKELVENSLLQEWVNRGRELHDKTDTCSFCGGAISLERRNELDAHFSKESEELKKELEKENDILNNLSIELDTFYTTNGIIKDLFYGDYWKNYKEIADKWNEVIKKHNEQIASLKKHLSNRKNDIFKPIEANLKDITDYSPNIVEIKKQLDELVQMNNEKTTTLDGEKSKALDKLRYDYIQKFIVDFEYKKKLKEIKDNDVQIDKKKEEITKLKEDISKLESELDVLRQRQRDEGLAADKINCHLKEYFGHEGLKLVSEEVNGEKSKTRFIIKRGNCKATNLSEGECSLVAFCYFMAKIEDEVRDEKSKDNLIIYIDDPISSLDNNHIFFMYGLIEKIIVVDKKFKQLFISTHNLEFLKHLSNLKNFDNKQTKTVGHFIVEKRKKDTEYRCILRKMPRYLRINISEYLYLFDQIYKLAQSKENLDEKIKQYEEQHTLLYSMGNNMRKFLECYMSYKYPDIDSPLHNLNLLFSGSIPRQINRLINEYSHLRWGTRGTLPIDVPEAEETARKIIEAIEKKDPEHYSSLVNCITKKEVKTTA